MLGLGKRSDKSHRGRPSLVKALLAITILLCLSAGTFLTISQHYVNLLFDRVERQYRQSLVNIVSVGRHAVEPVMTKVRSGEINREEAIRQIRPLIRSMTYEDQTGKNYVFMSSYDGTMLVQPFEPEKELTNQWGLQDANGLFIIRELVKAAKAHPEGSFVRYYYLLPGVYEMQEKVAYVVGLPEISCYIGTGMYMKKVITEQREMLSRVNHASLWLLVVVLIPISASVLVILKRNRQLLTEMRVREKVEEELKTSEAKYRSIFENAIEGIFQTTQDGHFISVNPALARMAGYESPQEMIDHSVSVDQYYADPEERKKWIEILGEKGFVENYVVRMKRRDGHLIWVSNTSRMVKDQNGDVLYYEGTIEDITKRKGAEEEVNTLAAIVRHSSEMVNLANIEGKMVFLNEAGMKGLGIDPEDVRSTDITDVIPDHMKPLVVNEVIPQLLATGSWNGDLQCVNLKTKAVTDVHTTAFLIDDPKDPSRRYLANISLDISQRREAERSLREKEQQLRGITENIPGTIFQFHARDSGEYSMNYISGKMLKILQLPPEMDAVFPVLLSTVYEEDRQRFEDSVRKAVVECTSWDFEGRFVTPSGDLMWFHGMATPTRHEKYVAFDGILLDTTVRKETEEKSRLSEEKFSKVFLSTPDGIAITRLRDGQIIDVNPGFEEILGWKKAEILGRTSLEIGFWANPGDRGTMVGDLSAGRDVLYREFQFRRKDGSLHTGIYSARSIRIAGEECIIFAVHDITEQRQLEEERRKLEQQLFQSQKMDAIGRLAGGVAHDFNNVLLAVSGNAKLAATDLAPDHPVQTILNEIINGCNRATDLVRQILLFSRPQVQEPKVIRLQNVAREALRLIRATIPAMIKTEAHFDPEVPPIFADASQIHQIVVNLATNAVQAIGEKKGRIEFRIDEAARQNIPENLPDGRYVRLSVIDDGCGMEPTIVERIFDPFFTTKGTGQGTGLGLSVVHGIMKSLGGWVAVKSQPGKGSVFSLYFPAVTGESKGETAEPQTARAAHPQGRRVLHVDDDRTLVLLIGRMLERFGYVVTGFTDAVLALEEFRSRPDDFDVVVTDLSMPDMSGFSFATAVLEARPDMPVFVVTGYLDEKDERQAHQVGVRGLILKPNAIEELLRHFEQLW